MRSILLKKIFVSVKKNDKCRVQKIKKAKNKLAKIYPHFGVAIHDKQIKLQTKDSQ